MPEKKRRIVPSSGGNIIQGLSDYIRLVLRLMGDARVSPWLKILPIGTLVYLINPIDLPTPIDDAGVITLGLYMFVEMCPPDVVEEHRQAIRGMPLEWPGTSRDASKEGKTDGDVIDAEFHEEK